MSKSNEKHLTSITITILLLENYRMFAKHQINEKPLQTKLCKGCVFSLKVKRV